MLLKAAFRANKSCINVAKRSVYTIPGKNWVVPESVNDVVGYLDKNKPTFTCLYFHAAWNPICEKIEQDYDNFCNDNAAFTHIKVDCDATPKIKLFFDARYEPQFLILLNGTEIKRQVGYNFGLVENQLNQCMDFHYKDASYFGDSGEQWERFYDSFDRWAKDGEADRDAMRMMVDHQVDTHRGPGSIKQ